MAKHAAPDDGPRDPIVASVIALHADGGGAHAAELPGTPGALGWPGPQPDPTSALGWPGDLPR